MKKLMIFAVILLCLSIVSAAKINSDLEDKLDSLGDKELMKVIVSTNQKINLVDNLGLRLKGIRVENIYEFKNGFSTELNKKQVEELELDKNVLFIEEDYLVEAFLDRSAIQIDAKNVWFNEISGKDIEVAILDTGIDDDNPYLTVVQEVDFTGEGTDDLNGHGTHVAGIVSSKHETYKGIAYDSNLVDVKVLNRYGQGYASDILRGIEWAVKNNVDIISLSLGATLEVCDGTDIISQAANWAVDRGVVVVVAAGNNGPELGTITSPGCAEKVITVGCVDDYNEITLFSGRGPTADGRIKPDLVAPGMTITSTYNNGGFATLTGTSMSTPHISGSVALLLEVNPELSVSEIKNILINRAVNLNYDSNIQGGGLVNVYDSYVEVYNLTYPPILEPPINETIPDNETQPINETLPNNKTIIKKPKKNQTAIELPGLRRGQNKITTRLPPGQAKKLEEKTNEETMGDVSDSSGRGNSNAGGNSNNAISSQSNSGSPSSQSNSGDSNSGSGNSNSGSGNSNAGGNSNNAGSGNSNAGGNGRGNAKGLTGRVIYWIQELFN